MATIRYKFVATGADSVIAAYKGIAKAAQDSAAAAQRSAKRVQDAETRRSAAMKRTSGADTKRRASEELAAVRNLEREKTRIVMAETRAREKTARDRAVSHQRAMVRIQGEARAPARAPAQERVGGGALMGAAGVAGAGMMAMVGSVAGMTAQGMKVDEMARRIAINSRLGGGKMLDARAMRQQMYDVAGETPGMTAESLAGATLAFQGATGQVLDAESLKSLATVASASGSAIEDVAAAAAALSNNLNITKVEDMGEALSILAVQGAKGQFELKDMAALMGRISAAAAGANVEKSVAGVARVGALAQIARQGGGSAEQATTAVENVFRQMTAHSDMFKKAGVDVFQKGTKGREMRSVNDVIVETFKRTEGNRTQLGKMFGAQADPIMNILSDVFNQEMKKSNDLTKAGEAVRKKLEEAANVTEAKNIIDEAAAVAQQSTSAKVTAAWEKATGKVTDTLLPAMADAFTKLEESGAIDAVIDAFEFAADVISENMKFVSEMMEMMGFQKKGPDLQKQLAAAEKKEERLAKKIKAAETPQEREALTKQHADVVAEKKRIHDEMYKPVLAGSSVAIGKGGGRQFMTRQQFVEQYFKEMGGEQMNAISQMGVRGRAEELFQRIGQTGTREGTTIDRLADLTSPTRNVGRGGAETEKASQLVERVISERMLMGSKSQQKALGVEVGGELDTASFEKLIAAANSAAAALGKVAAQPTVVGQ